jgi:poly-gamma-glutamate capsule biosynthesis protein CapA/YwtB (metallophosphatase superfamily)
VIAVGDLSLNGRFARLLGRRGAGYPLRSVLPDWGGADLVLGNLESPLATAPRASPSKVTLRAAPGSAEALRAARFDALTLANNHVMDFGPDGLAETIAALDAAGIAHAGAGPDEAAAAAPLVLERNGQSIGLLAFCDVEQSSPLYAATGRPGAAALRTDLAERAIRALRPRVDWVILQLHWGTEMARLPSPSQRNLARRLVEAGADLILGHHPHVAQPWELVGGCPVFYSLGNLLFSDMYWRGRVAEGEPFVSRVRIHPLSRQTGWAEVQLRPGRPAEARFVPARVRSDLSVVRDDSARCLSDLERLGRRLRSVDYAAEFSAEAGRAERRLRWVFDWTPLLRRIELKLFQHGLLFLAAEGT